MENTETPYIRFFRIIIILLLLPALFINLGLVPIILDEGTRGVVALEMLFSGNYVVPTINGEFYYNKPPLFNWIIIAFVKFTGSINEFALRLPVVLSLIGFALTVYFTLKRELGKETAFITAIALITCGRIFFYDSFRGLIDISFSWLTYFGFWVAYYYSRREEYLKLFLFSWLITSIGFLMKGLPSLVFQGLTLLTVFTYRKQFKILFSWKHIVSFLIFLVIAGTYFYTYHQYNDLDNYWNALWTESAKRTVIDNPLTNTIIHLFTFPFEFILHFLPWSLLLIFLAGKGRLAHLLSYPLTKFFIFIFLANILIYWFSPEIYPRYLFMFLPLVFGTATYTYLKFGKNTWVDRYIWQGMMMTFGLILVFTLLILPFTEYARLFQHMFIPWILLLIVSLMLTFFLIRYKVYRLYLFICLFIITRIAFNIFVLPERYMNGYEKNLKAGIIEAARISEEKRVFLYKDCPMHHTSTFYFTAEKKEILSRWYGELQRDVFYFVHLDDSAELKNIKIVHQFETGQSRQPIVMVIRTD
jgi:4-amino-4-deoxy-L-arabinose transferase-like glycosyltransferase